MVTRSRLVCSACGAETPQWAGRCGTCNAWNTIVESLDMGRGASSSPIVPAVPMVEVDAHGVAPISTGVGEFDRVLGGGLVPGSVTLVGGPPGIGKSTLLLQVAARRAGTSLYLTAEESAGQVRRRAERVDAIDSSILVAADTNLRTIVHHIESTSPALVVIDSIQTVFDPDIGSVPGSMTQVRECTSQLVSVAKSRNVAVVLVGHVTKDGSLAGPRVLEHLVDTVVSFEGERHDRLRIIRAVKHRFGPTNDIGLLEMTESGLAAVADPSRSFLADRRDHSSGSAVVAIVEGRRPLLVEVQSLVVSSSHDHPRRHAHGVDGNRLNLMLAVLERRANVPMRNSDVYAMAVGGVRVSEPGGDAALALAVASSVADVALPPDLVVVAEVGLGGELRAVGAMEDRLSEAARLGFRSALVPQSSGDVESSLDVHPVATLCDAIEWLGLRSGGGR